MNLDLLLHLVGVRLARRAFTASEENTNPCFCPEPGGLVATAFVPLRDASSQDIPVPALVDVICDFVGRGAARVITGTSSERRVLGSGEERWFAAVTFTVADERRLRAALRGASIRLGQEVWAAVTP